MIKLEFTYQNLPEIFYQKNSPTPVNNPGLVIYNEKLARELGIHSSELEKDIEFFSGNKIIANSVPISQAYAGHQFGHFNPLGDGRAHLLGEIIDSKNKRWDIQLKGSGQSQYSRRGDGRAALGPMLREYIISEFMAAVGIPTTRSLAVVFTGEPVFRETVLKGAILTRVAASHIRVGTFEFAAYKGGKDAVKALADYTIARHYPELSAQADKYIQFLKVVCKKQAGLIAQWMNIGFIHGVMNTDNMTISGETIDFGPCAFIDTFDPSTVFSSIDQQGRYAYGNQPAMAQWNLARFAEALLPLFDEDSATAIKIAEEIINAFREQFQKLYYQGIRNKLGLQTENDQDFQLFESLFQQMKDKKLDYTKTFSSLTNGESILPEWEMEWQQRIKAENGDIKSSQQLMQKNNPQIIPRNFWVEKALTMSSDNSDFSLVNDLIEALQRPFALAPEAEKFTESPATPNDYKTFCGT